MITPQQARDYRRTRRGGSAYRSLSPSFLADAIDQFDHGSLTTFHTLATAIAERDATIKCVKSKREMAISGARWNVLTLDRSPEALEQKAVLEHFWNHVTATDIHDRNVKGGFSALVRQLMGAVSFRYAAHHIVWQETEPVTIEGPTGGKVALPGITATFEHVPLFYFENTTGALRYIDGSDGAGIEGQALTPGEWLVTVGEGLMVTCAICHLFKRMSLHDWVAFNEKYGMPGIHASTDAAPDSREWDAVCGAVGNFMNDFAMVTTKGTDLKLLEANTGDPPFEPLVERMDRGMAALYMGCDLSTMSAGTGAGTGASQQGKESAIVRGGDAEMITEALNQIDRMVREHAFPGASGKAYTQIQLRACEKKEEVSQTIKQLDFLVKTGARVSVSKTLERLGIPPAREGEAVLGQRSNVPTHTRSVTSGNAKPGGPRHQPASVCRPRHPGLKLTPPSPQLLIAIPLFTAHGGPLSAGNIAQQTQKDWLLIAPYGRHPTALVNDPSIKDTVQVFDRICAENLVAVFEALKAGTGMDGAPIYIGHPDILPNVFKDSRERGRIVQLEAREDGLYGRARWNDLGMANIEEGRHIYPSVAWDVALNGREIFPIEFKSLGLWENPNIKGVTPIGGTIDPTVTARKMQERQTAALAIVNSRMEATGESYSEAWESVKRVRATAHLFN